MKVSLNTIKQLTGLELPPVPELVERLNAQLGGVEQVIDLSAKYKGATIVKVVECEKHTNADKLSVCKIDAGTGELLQVVCGAPNVKASMWAVWLPPESVVPSTFDDNKPYKLGARELRGVMSSGILASAKELDLGDDHSGIVEITDNDLPEAMVLEPGASFAKIFGLDDTILDIENKMFTHRPDCFGQIGVAREIAGIFGRTFTDPTWYVESSEPKERSNSFELEGFNTAGDRVPRLMLIGLDNITIKPSPLWLRAKLTAMGGKPINNVVDITNYMMLMTAQPMHAYDYDKLAGGKVGARMAKDGERLTLLNGKTFALTTNDIVIADDARAIGLAGIMGGGESEVSADTTRIVLECATFDMYTVRKSSMRHGIFTDALTRFNKGQSMLMNPFIMQQAVSMLESLAGASVAAETYDDLKDENGDWRAKPVKMPMLEAATISTSFINSRLGTDLASSDIVTLLQNVGFECNSNGEEVSYWAPAWRMDIQLPEDVVEEVGRLYGFDKLPRVLPQRASKPAPKNSRVQTKQAVRRTLSRYGANEVLTYSFVHEKILLKSEQDPSKAYKLSNALSPDLQYYRLSLTPSLLDKVHMNIKAGYQKFALFEIGKAHLNGLMDDNEPTVPAELNRMAMVIAGNKSGEGASFYEALRYANQLSDTHELVPLETYTAADESTIQLIAPYEQRRSAIMLRDNQVVGVVGEFKKNVRKVFKLPGYASGFELDTDMLLPTKKSYTALSKFPSVYQDISLRVATDVRFSDLDRALNEALNKEAEIDLSSTVEMIYKANTDSATKTITFRITAASHNSTLVDADVTAALDRVLTAMRANIDIERV